MFVKRSIFVIFALILFSGFSFSQSVGKLYDKAEANSVYGSVIKTVSIARSSLKKVLEKTNNYVMFRIVDSQVVILGDDRIVLRPAQYSVSAEDVFQKYSKGKVIELLNMGKEATVHIEQRESPVTLTNGNYTLEGGIFCPPYCD